VSYFAVLREPGEQWDHMIPMRSQVAWDQHAKFMDDLAAEGFIVLGGPVGNGEQRFLIVVDAPSPEVVTNRLSADPWVPMGLLRTVSVEPWQILLGGQRT
jgi:uncharacterized protein YciI